MADRWKARKTKELGLQRRLRRARAGETVFFFFWNAGRTGGRLLENPHLRARFAYTGRLSSGQRAPHGPRLARPGTRPAALGEPAPTREVPDCPPPSRRASQGPGLARTSPVWLPATERRFVHSALNPCCCYVVSTPDIYPTTITSSQGRNQPTASWSPSTAT